MRDEILSPTREDLWGVISLSPMAPLQYTADNHNAVQLIHAAHGMGQGGLGARYLASVRSSSYLKGGFAYPD
jgi:hypothetical protein